MFDPQSGFKNRYLKSNIFFAGNRGLVFRLGSSPCGPGAFFVYIFYGFDRGVYVGKHTPPPPPEYLLPLTLGGRGGMIFRPLVFEGKMQFFMFLFYSRPVRD
jgi:hypothetical protein